MPELIVNADDFGLDESIDRAIISLVKMKRVSAVSVLVSSKDFSISRLLELTKLNVSIGLHFALTDTTPCSSTYPEKFMHENDFLVNWKELFLRTIIYKLEFDSVYLELQSQYSKLKKALVGSDKEISFIDSHQNIHFWPSIAKVVLEFQRDSNMPLIRKFGDSYNVKKILSNVVIFLGSYLYSKQKTFMAVGMHDSCKMNFDLFSKTVEKYITESKRFAIVVHPGLESKLKNLNYTLNWREEYDFLSSDFLGKWLNDRSISVLTFDELGLNELAK